MFRAATAAREQRSCNPAVSHPDFMPIYARRKDDALWIDTSERRSRADAVTLSTFDLRAIMVK